MCDQPDREFKWRQIGQGAGGQWIRVADEFGDNADSCDAVFGVAGHGAHAEYLTMAADGAVCLMPDSLGFDAAAAVSCGALVALVFLLDFAQVKAGQKVVIIGASGGVGVFLVHLAKPCCQPPVGLCRWNFRGAKYGRPVIDGAYCLDRIVDAPQRVESRHKTGAVVVDVAGLANLQLAAE